MTIDDRNSFINYFYNNIEKFKLSNNSTISLFEFNFYDSKIAKSINGVDFYLTAGCEVRMYNQHNTPSDAIRIRKEIPVMSYKFEFPESISVLKSYSAQQRWDNDIDFYFDYEDYPLTITEESHFQKSTVHDSLADFPECVKMYELIKKVSASLTILTSEGSLPLYFNLHTDFSKGA